MNKIRLLTLIAIITTFGISYAQKVDESTARNIGMDFLAKKKAISSPTASRIPAQEDSYELAYTATKDGKDCYYVYNCTSGGFVIVSADNRTSKPILGYSTSSTFNSSKIGINIKSWLDIYSNQILALDTIKENVKAASAIKSNVANRHFIQPLVPVTWGQGEPYNKLCPTDYYGQPCLTGCVATAMAQVIYTLGYSSKATTINGYTTKRNKINIPALPPTTFDWDNLNEDEIAKLMRYCGQSVMMDYGPKTSGADMHDVEEALEKTFGFSVSTDLIKHDFFNEKQWSDYLFSELSSGRPLIYAGRGTSGHAFVIDGYDDAEDLFHVNWGWDGDCDGYYMISNLCPNSYDDFSEEQMAIIAMLPQATQITDDHAVNIYSFEGEAFNFSKNETNEYTFNCGKWAAVSDIKQDGGIEIGLGLYDENEQFISELTFKRINLFNHYVYQDYKPTVTLDNSLNSGEYKIYLVSRVDEYSPWKKSYGSDRFYFNVSISSDEINISPVPMYHDYSSRYRDYGKVKIDNYYYHLFYDYHFYANLTSGSTKYSGNLYIPDAVEYNGDVFTVLGIEDLWFGDDSSVRSISLGMRDCPYFCYDNIHELEMREGVAKAYRIDACQNLTELTYPCSCWELLAPSNCTNLKKITIKYTGQVKIEMRENDWSESSMPNLKDIYIYSEYPPLIIKKGEYKLSNHPHLKVHIPEGSKLAYLNSEWKDWNLVEDLPNNNPQCVEIDYIGEDHDSAGQGPSLQYQNCDVEFGMKIPAKDLLPYIGSAITGIKFFTTPVLYNDWSWENVEYAFITDDDNDYLVKKDCITLRGQWTIVKFDEPYLITDDIKDIYAGIGRTNVILQLLANNNHTLNGSYERVMKRDSDVDYDIEFGKWDNEFFLKHFDGSAFRIKAIIEGENYPTDIVISYERPTCVDNKLRVRIHSRTIENVENVSISMTIDEKLYPQQTVSTSLITNHDQYIDLELPKDITEGYHEVKLQVISVNGLADEIDSNSTRSGTIYINIEEGIVNSIIATDGNPFDVYDLNGVKIKTHTDNISDLPNGIYIINGQKFVINN